MTGEALALLEGTLQASESMVRTLPLLYRDYEPEERGVSAVMAGLAMLRSAGISQEVVTELLRSVAESMWEDD